MTGNLKYSDEVIIEACHQAQARTRAALSNFDAVYITFSHRERELLRRIAENGADTKPLAEALEISPVTAAAHIRALRRKVGVEYDDQLIVYVMQQPAAVRQPRASCKRGIHFVDPACPCPHCRALSAA